MGAEGVFIMKKTTLFLFSLAMATASITYGASSQGFVVGIENNTPYQIGYEHTVNDNNTVPPSQLMPGDKSGRILVNQGLHRFPNIQVNLTNGTYLGTFTFQRMGGKLPAFKPNARIELFETADGDLGAMLNGEQLEVKPLTNWFQTASGKQLQF